MTTAIHMLKLAVGVDALAQLYEWEMAHLVRYEGRSAVPCMTRYIPKRADEMLATGGSLYRVVAGRIQCRRKILGFEVVETEQKGTMSLIMQDPVMMRTIATPKRPFQGWRYLKAADAPEDLSVYEGDEEASDAEIMAELKHAGLL